MAAAFCSPLLSESNSPIFKYGLACDLIWPIECGESNFVLSYEPRLQEALYDSTFALRTSTTTII